MKLEHIEQRLEEILTDARMHRNAVNDARSRAKSIRASRAIATTHTGAGRFTYPAGTATMLLRTSNSEVGSSAATTTIDAATHTISGSVTSGNFCGYINQVGRRSYYTLFFTVTFDKPFASTGTWQGTSLRPGTTTASGGTTYGTDGFPVHGKGSGGYVTFDLSSGRTVNARVGISYVSLANARANLAAENPAGTTFDTVRQRAHSAWNTELNRLEVRLGSPCVGSWICTPLDSIHGACQHKFS